jgi:uncharacterized protein DUF4168
MRFKLRTAAVCAAALCVSMIVTFPSFAMAAANGNSSRSAGALYAQAGTTNSGTAMSPSTVDDATLKRTAVAYVKVRDIAIKARQAINSTDDSARKEQLANESEAAKLEAVKQAGMEPQEYNAVLQKVQADQGLQQKFLAYVQQASQAS